VVLILFGVPLSDGRSLIQTLDFALEAMDLLPSISIGVSCGFAYAGWVGSDQVKEYTALGHPLNIAARLMHRAKKNEALCDNNVWLALHEPYDLVYLSSIKLKGVAKPIRYHRIMRRKLSDRFHFKHSFVGRESELAILNEAITASIRQKRSRIIYISGEPGQGKSRLAYESMLRFNKYQELIVNCREDAHRPLEAIAQIVRQLLGLNDKADKDELKAEYQRNYERLFAEGVHPEVEISTLASLLGISYGASVWEATAVGMRAQKQEQAFLALLRFILDKEPLLLMLDDAQWLDAHSLALLRKVSSDSREALLILAPSRLTQDGTVLNLGLPNLDCQHLELERLSLGEAEILLHEILRVSSLPQASIELIYNRAGGNPFFIEQITMYLLESDLLDDKAGLTKKPGNIPSFSISDVINSRIDGFTENMQECLYHASVLGMMFNVTVLRQMLNKSIESNLQTGLQHKLWTGLSELQYMFSHIVLRDQIYKRMVQDKVLQLHKLAAETLIKLYGDEGCAQSGEIAHHYEAARDIDAAIRQWIKAAEYAMQHGTWQEAVSCQRRAVILSGKHHGFGSDQHNQRLFWLALHYHYIQHYIAAEPLYLLALKRRTAMLGQDDPALSPYLNNVGRFYKDIGRWDMAEELLRKSLRIEHLNQARSSNVADRVNNLASLFAKMGLLKKAMSYSVQSLKMFTESDHHEKEYFVALLQNNIASLLIRMEKLEAAESYALSALAAMESTKSEKHPRAAHCHLNLFQIRYQQRRFQDATLALEQATSRFKHFFGESNPEYARCLIYHGDLLHETNDAQAAVESWRKALNILQQTIAPDHPLMHEAKRKVAGISA
jgi:adenylate cyclase